MASLAHHLAAGLGGDASVSDTISREALLALWGEDLLFTDDLQVAPNGDYQLVSGLAALRQAIWIRLVTAPGEIAWRPGFGVGALDYLGSIGTAARVSELKGRVRDQLLQDPRLEAVTEVAVSEQTINDKVALVIGVAIVAAGKAHRLPFVLQR